MSLSFVVLTSLIAVFLSVLRLRIYLRGRRGGQGPNATEFLSLYRADIAGFLQGIERVRTGESFFHYILLHLIVPFAGFAFLLRSDLNFLVVILSILWSLQLSQRIYPGISDSDAAE
jgi:hypothetical protein